MRYGRLGINSRHETIVLVFTKALGGGDTHGNRRNQFRETTMMRYLADDDDAAC